MWHHKWTLFQRVIQLGAESALGQGPNALDRRATFPSRASPGELCRVGLEWTPRDNISDWSFKHAQTMPVAPIEELMSLAHPMNKLNPSRQFGTAYVDRLRDICVRPA